MKFWSLTFLQLLVFSIVLSSCQKEVIEPEEVDTTPASEQLVTNEFTVNVDGAEFSYTLISVDEQVGNIISVAASTPQGYPLVNIAVPKSIDPGTSSFGGQFGTTRGMYVIGDGVDFEYAADIGTGTMNIMEHDKSLKVIKGSFSFTATPVNGSTSTDSYSLTGGNFVIQY